MQHLVKETRKTPKNNARKYLERKLNGLQSDAAEFVLQKCSVLQTASHLYEGLDTPTSLGLWMCLQANDIESIVSHKLSINQFETSFFHSRDFVDRSYQSVAFLKKVKWEIDGIDPCAAAKESVREYEALCRQTNDRFQRLFDGGIIPTALCSVFHAATGIINRCLGVFDADEWIDACRFGPGVNYLSGSSCYDKMRASPSVTMDFANLGLSLVNSSPSWVSAVKNLATEDGTSVDGQRITLADVQLVQGGKFSLVSKNALTHRDIEVQPLLNGFAQAGLGRMIKLRLKRCGLDLARQPAKNRRLAELGSVLDHNVTIDLKGASNTVSKKLAEYFLPPEWFCAMDVCRTRFLVDFPEKGDVLPLERFSSMGNGYTFELETLIFWALTRACSNVVGEGDSDVAVFGDDIICEKRTAKLLTEVVLPFCGFVVNQDKSFFSGPFRESCGGDYLRGRNVRPYFFKGACADDIQTAISLCNGLRRKSMQASQNYFSDSRYRSGWTNARRGIPTDLRLSLSGPLSDQDMWIICDDGDYLRNRLLVMSNWIWHMPALRMAYRQVTPSQFTAAKAAMLNSISGMENLDTQEDVYYSDYVDNAARMIGERTAKPFTVYTRTTASAQLVVTMTQVDPCGIWL